ncbi:MAG TPA: ParB/RepB/Spo0J family partition protein [Nitrospiraceae bacterium]
MAKVVETLETVDEMIDNEELEVVEEQEEIGDTIELLPEQLTILEEQAVRPWAGDEDAEKKRNENLERLADSIKKNGQLQHIGVRLIEAGDPDENEYEVLYGHRRVAAIALLNETAKKPIYVKCMVYRDVDSKEALQKAMAENLHREDFSPMDLALDIQRIRTMYGWEGGKGTRSVAAFLGVSPATITQHEKLFTLDDDIQAQVHNGKISAQAAFDLAAVKPEKRKAVMDRAAELQAEENGDGNGGEAGENGDGEAATAAGNGKIKRGNVLAAARQTEDALQVAKPMTRKEILDWIGQFDGPGNGYANSAERQFCRYFVSVWAKGEGSDKKLNKLWADLTESAPEGTETKADRAAEVVEPKGKGKR